MKNLFHKIEGWKTKDGNFHETENMARIHALKLEMQELCTMKEYATTVPSVICDNAQAIYNILSDLGFRRSIIEAPAMELAPEKPRWEVIRDYLSVCGWEHANVRVFGEKGNVTITLYTIGDEDQRVMDEVSKSVYEIVPKFVVVKVLMQPLPPGRTPGISFEFVEHEE